MPCAWEIPWCSGAPLPHVLSSGRRTILVYRAKKSDPNWDGRRVTVVDPTSPAQQSLVLVEFKRCYIHKFGGPNDEVAEGLPWEGKGLDAYGAYIIENSRWLEEVKQINSVHSQYSEASWTRFKHFVLLFHDEMFECLAKGFELESLQGSFADALEVGRLRLTT